MLHIFCLVEGHGEERGYPNLIRNFYNHRGRHEINILRPYRLGKDHFHKADEISEIVRFGCSRIRGVMDDGDSGLVLISHDSDGACPVELRSDIEDKLGDDFALDSIEIVICHREFEAWFLAGAQSFAGNADCRNPIPEFQNPEGIQDAKGTFERAVLREGRYYSETVDQQKFAALLNFELHPENNARSLRRLVDVLSEA